jgi:hypothetical protein
MKKIIWFLVWLSKGSLHNRRAREAAVNVLGRDQVREDVRVGARHRCFELVVLNVRGDRLSSQRGCCCCAAVSK